MSTIESNTYQHIAVACDIRLGELVRQPDGPKEIQVDPVAIAVIYDTLNDTEETLEETLLFIASHHTALANKKVSILGDTQGIYTTAKNKQPATIRVAVTVNAGSYAHANLSKLPTILDSLKPDQKKDMQKLIPKIAPRKRITTTIDAMWKGLASIQPYAHDAEHIQRVSTHEIQHAVNLHDEKLQNDTRTLNRAYARKLLGKFLGIDIGFPAALGVGLVETTTMPVSTAVLVGTLASYCVSKISDPLVQSMSNTRYERSPEEEKARQSEALAVALPNVIKLRY